MLCTTMAMITDYLSLNSDAVLSARGIGYDFGLDIAKAIDGSSHSLDAVVAELSAYWQKNDMGNVIWRDREKGFLALKRRSPRVRRNHKGRLCAFVEGMLEGVVKTRTGQRFEVRETRCGLSNGQVCIFGITPH